MKKVILLLALILLSQFVYSGKLEVTDEHPFLINNSWIPAKQLVIGDLITTWDGKVAKITEIKSINKNIPVYNLEDKYFHNYVVGEDNLVVHNSKLNDESSLAKVQLPTPQCKSCLIVCNSPNCGGINLGELIEAGDIAVYSTRGVAFKFQNTFLGSDGKVDVLLLRNGDRVVIDGVTWRIEAVGDYFTLISQASHLSLNKYQMFSKIKSEAAKYTQRLSPEEISFGDFALKDEPSALEDFEDTEDTESIKDFFGRDLSLVEMKPVVVEDLVSALRASGSNFKKLAHPNLGHERAFRIYKEVSDNKITVGKVQEGMCGTVGNTEELLLENFILFSAHNHPASPYEPLMPSIIDEQQNGDLSSLSSLRSRIPGVDTRPIELIIQYSSATRKCKALFIQEKTSKPVSEFLLRALDEDFPDDLNQAQIIQKLKDSGYNVAFIEGLSPTLGFQGLKLEELKTLLKDFEFTPTKILPK